MRPLCVLMLLAVGCAHGSKTVEYVNASGKAVYFDFDASNSDLDEASIKAVSDAFIAQVSPQNPDKVQLDLPPEVRAVILSCPEDDSRCSATAMSLLIGESVYAGTLKRDGSRHVFELSCLVIEEHQFRATCHAKAPVTFVDGGHVRLGKLAVPKARE